MHITLGTARRKNAAIMRASIPLLALLACTCTAPYKPSERFTTVTLGFPATSQVTSISARTITSAGDVVELSHDEFHRYTHTDVRIEGDSIVYDIRCRLLGESCAELRSRLSTMLRSEYVEMFRDMLHDGLSTAVLRRFSTQMEVGDTSMSVEMRLVESRTGALQEGLLFIPAVPIDITDMTRWAVAEQRSQPVFLRYRRSIRDTVVVSFDGRIYSVLSKPASTRSKLRSALTFECRNMSLTGEHRVMADLECEKREIPAGEYEAFRRNVLGAVHARRGYVVVKYF